MILSVTSCGNPFVGIEYTFKAYNNYTALFVPITYILIIIQLYLFQLYIYISLFCCWLLFVLT